MKPCLNDRVQRAPLGERLQKRVGSVRDVCMAPYAGSARRQARGQAGGGRPGNVRPEPRGNQAPGNLGSSSTSLAPPSLGATDRRPP